MKKLRILFLVLVFAFPLTSLAQGQTISQLEALIRQLQAQLSELKSKQETQTIATPGTDTCGVFTSILRIGSAGDEVARLHNILKEQGFPVITTSNYNYTRATAEAVSKFQLKYSSEILAPYGLTNGTGFVGLSTRTKLNKLYPPCTGDNIKVIIPAKDSSFLSGEKIHVAWTDGSGNSNTRYRVDAISASNNVVAIMAESIASTSTSITFSRGSFTDGYYHFRVCTSDLSRCESGNRFKLTNNQANVPGILKVVYEDVPQGIKGSSYTGYVGFQTLAAYDASAGIESGSLPPGLNTAFTHEANKCSSSSRLCLEITGTPTQAGKYNFTISLEQEKNRLVTREYTIDIVEKNAGSLPSPLSIDTNWNLPSVKAGDSYDQTITATGGNESYNWSVVGELPPGLSKIEMACRGFEACKTPFTISGKPTTPGKYTFTIAVDSGSQRAVRLFNMTVTEDTPPIMSSNSGIAGYADAITCDIFGGWAKDDRNPEASVEIEIWSHVNSKYWKRISSTTANINRADVGNHAFSLYTPQALKDGGNHKVHLFAKNSSSQYYELVGSGVTINCALGSRNQGNLMANTINAIKSLIGNLLSR